VYPHFGLGENLPGLLSHTTLQEIVSWSPVEIQLEVLREYLHQKSLYPAAIPATREDMAMSQAIARQALRLAFQAARRDFPRTAAALKPGLTPLFDPPILAGGAAISDAPSPGQSLLLLLDALQPVGVSTIILDQNRLLPLLGAAAGRNSLLPVQILESGAFMSLGTVISLVGTAPYGSVILQAKLSYEDGTDARAEVKSGSLAVLPLPAGQAARLALKPEAGWARASDRAVRNPPGHRRVAGRGVRWTRAAAGLAGRCRPETRIDQELVPGAGRLKQCWHPYIIFCL
jgi:hypothetical protein